MSTISDIHNPWRDDLMPASFRRAMFHVEGGSKESGRRIVTHEFPKKELPYSEDMGRRALEFSVRGYCISYPYDAEPPLYRRDYRVARDELLQALETEGHGELQLPFIKRPFIVVCPKYRLVEEERLGGYCVFDMHFVEFGASPSKPAMTSRESLLNQSEATRGRAIDLFRKGVP